MPYAVNPSSAATALNLAYSGSRTSSSNGSGVDMLAYEGEIAVLLNCGAATAGSSPTMDFVVQESSDNSTFTDVTGGSFTQVTSSDSLQKLTLNRSDLKRYLRLKWTIGGTSSPAFPFAAEILAWKKYPA